MIKCKISPLALGLAFGVVWGLSVFITGLTALFFSYGKPFVDAMSTMYIGYEPSLTGSLLGGLFGFLDGLIGGAIIACLYNCFATKCCCRPSKNDMDDNCHMPAPVKRHVVATAKKPATVIKKPAAIKKPVASKKPKAKKVVK
ncbi:MAG: bacteriophage holin [Gammaproteobacteria bacterium]|nr:bacteriophage holin [Gammaproteobacteria bacterium]